MRAEYWVEIMNRRNLVKSLLAAPLCLVAGKAVSEPAKEVHFMRIRSRKGGVNYPDITFEYRDMNEFFERYWEIPREDQERFIDKSCEISISSSNSPDDQLYLSRYLSYENYNYFITLTYVASKSLGIIK